MDFSEVSNLSVSTGIRFFSKLMPKFAIGPNFIVRTKKGSKTSHFTDFVSTLPTGGIDISSSLEDNPGVKSSKKVSDFLLKAKKL